MKTENNLADVLVSDIMTSHVETLIPSDSIKDAIGLMLEGGLTTVPVVDHANKVVGVLSRTDLTEMFMEEDSELSRSSDVDFLSLGTIYQSLETSDDKQVHELMTVDVKTVGSDQSLRQACQEMVRFKIHHLPVVDDEGRLKGILSAFDVVKALAQS